MDLKLVSFLLFLVESELNACYGSLWILKLNQIEFVHFYGVLGFLGGVNPGRLAR